MSHYHDTFGDHRPCKGGDILFSNCQWKTLEIELDGASGLPLLKFSKKDLYFKVTFELLSYLRQGV